MKFSFLLLATGFAFVGWAGEASAGESPVFRSVERTDSNSRAAHEQLLKKARAGGIDVYFIGDSITRRWGATDAAYAELLHNWTTNFFGWNAANFGWGGDKLENILWRLENGELDGVSPKIIVVLGGINNIGTEAGGPERASYIRNGLQAIVDICHKKAPEAVIVLTALFPRNDNHSVIPLTRQVNEEMAHLADGKRVRFLDINARLADEHGLFFPGMVNEDKLHPTVRAYQVWADALKPIFTELLGPPATTDHAPPPTGDPSQHLTAKQREVLAAELQWERALTNSDIAALERINDPSLVYTHSNGRVDTRNSYINAIKAGSTRYESMKRDDIQVNVFDHAAVVTCHWEVHIAANGNSIVMNARYLHVYVDGNDGWKLVAHESTRISP